MKTVKVMLEGKDGKEFEALVPVNVACLAMCYETYYKDARICRMGYSAFREMHDFYISKVTDAEEIDQDNHTMEMLTSIMEREERMVGLSGIELYRD